MKEQMERFFREKLQSRIENGSLSATMVNTLFQDVLKAEDKFGKDAAFFTVDEILEMLKAKESRSVGTLQNYVVILKQYADPINPMNDYQLINKKMLAGCVARKKADGSLITREKLDEMQGKMLNAVDKAIMECLFIGIAGKNLEDLTSLCQNQLDSSTGVLTLASGKTVQLTQTQQAMLQAAFDETVLDSYGAEQKSSTVGGLGRLYKRKPNAQKPETADRKFRWVMRQFDIWCENFGYPYLTMKSVVTSGLVHELKLGMEQTGLSLRDYLKTDAGQKLAARYDYTNSYYMDVIANKVKGLLSK